MGAVQNMATYVIDQPGVNLTAADLSAAANISFAKTGMSLDNFLEYLNVGIVEAQSQNNVAISYNSVLQAKLLIAGNLLVVIIFYLLLIITKHNLLLFIIRYLMLCLTQNPLSGQGYSTSYWLILQILLL
jgi:hypothetical protein